MTFHLLSICYRLHNNYSLIFNSFCFFFLLYFWFLIFCHHYEKLNVGFTSQNNNEHNNNNNEKLADTFITGQSSGKLNRNINEMKKKMQIKIFPIQMGCIVMLMFIRPNTHSVQRFQMKTCNYL